MNLVIDIGNTRSKYGVFKGSQLVVSSVFHDELTSEGLENIVTNYGITRIGIANVGSASNYFSSIIKTNEKVLLIDQTTPSPFKTKYTTPLSLGIDRICGSLAAAEMFAGQNNLVIDIGTCITYDMITKDGWHLGGGISPGFKMRLKAMHAFTARLPEVEFNGEYPVIGSNTNQSMIFGGVAGTTAEINGMIRHFNGLHNNLNVILTGGDHSLFVQHIENPIFAAPNLVLEGINKILLHNTDAE